MLITFKYRLYPNKEQRENIDFTLERCHLLYNRLLAERKLHYEETGQGLSQYDQNKTLPERKKYIPALKEVHSQVLQDVSRRVDRSFQNFFRGIREGENIGYPRFATFHRYNSFTYPQSGFSLHGNRLQVSKIGNLKIKLHRPVEGEIKQLTIVRKNDRYYACFCCKVEAGRRDFPVTGKAVGIDVGITNYVATSDHELIPSIHAYRKNLKQLKRLQRKLDKQKKGSKRRRNTAKAIARLHEKIANTRRDLAYKTANKLLSEYDIVVHEDLQIQNMVRNPNLALSIQDMGWGLLFATLSAMAQTSATKKVIKVDPKNTSQLCSGCNEMVKKDLSERIHSCDICALEIDRDINASINILNHGLKLMA